MNGKVFYNNDGRQVGTNAITLKVLTASVPYNYSPQMTDRYSYIATMIYDYDGTIKSVSGSTDYTAFPTNNRVWLSASKILYFTYSYYPGVIFNIVYGGNYSNFECVIQQAGEHTLEFSYAQGTIHLNTRKTKCNGSIINIYYI